MRARKPRAWNWNPRDIAPQWREQFSSLVVGYPIWTSNQDMVFDIGGYKDNVDIFVGGGVGGIILDDGGFAFESTGDEQFVSNYHYWRGTSFFAGPGQRFTILCRFKTTNSGGSLFSVAGAAAGNRQLQTALLSGGLLVTVRGSTTNFGASMSPSDGERHDIAVTWDGTALAVYFDGEFLGNASVGSASEETTQQLCLLSRTNGSGYILDGQADYLYGFNEAWTHKQIRRFVNDPYGFLYRKSDPLFYGVSVPAGVGGASIEIHSTSQSQGLQNTGLVQAHSLVTDDLRQQQSFGNVVLNQMHDLPIGSIVQSQDVDSVLLAVSGDLVIEELIQAQHVNVTSLVQQHQLEISDSRQEQTQDSINLDQAHLILIHDIDQIQELAGTALAVSLHIDGISQGQLLEETTLDQALGLIIDGIKQDQNLDGFTLLQANVVQIDSMSQAQLIDLCSLGAPILAKLDGEFVMCTLMDAKAIKITCLIDGEVMLGSIFDSDITIN